MSTRTREDIATFLPWAVLLAAIAQAAVPIVPFAGPGATPGSSGADLLISPASYAFAIWGLIYLLAIAYAVVVLIKGGTGTAAPVRLQGDLLGAYLGAAAWIGLSAIDVSWATALVLVVMAVLLVDAVLVVARLVAESTVPGWVTMLARTTVGIYAAWVTVAVFLNLASAASELGLADPDALSWQLVLLVIAAFTGIALTAAVGKNTPGYALTLLWAFAAVLVTVWGGSTALVAVTVVALVAVLVVQASALW